MVLGDVNRARRLAGNPSTANVSDADITQALTYGTAQIVSFTGKIDWESDTANVMYPIAVMATEYYASSYIRDRFNDQGDISSEHNSRANSLVRQLADRLESDPTLRVMIAVGKYRSNPLNASAFPYRSMSQQGQELIGVGVPQYQIPPSTSS